jgi:hypothetical protein
VTLTAEAGQGGPSGGDGGAQPPIVKSTDRALPDVTDARKPAACPQVRGFDVVQTRWQSGSRTLTGRTLGRTAADGVWRCVMTGVENDQTVTYRSLPVLVTAGRRLMLTAEQADARRRVPLTVPVRSSARQRVVVRLYRQVGRRWKLSFRTPNAARTVARGASRLRIRTTGRAGELGPGRYRVVVRALSAAGKRSAPLVLHLTVR